MLLQQKAHHIVCIPVSQVSHYIVVVVVVVVVVVGGGGGVGGGGVGAGGVTATAKQEQLFFLICEYYRTKGNCNIFI